MPALVQRRPRHGDASLHLDVPLGRGAAGVTGRRLPEGGTWIDRSRPIGFAFDGRELTGFEGDTLSSALLANGIDVVCRSPILGRPRGIVSAGVEESSGFVEISLPWFDPIVAATMVDLVDGLVVTGRPGVGVLPADRPPTKPSMHRHAHVEVLVIGSGDGWLPAVEEAAAHGDRVLVVEREPRLAASGEGVTVLTNATALGLYDDGYAVVHERGPERDTLWHVRAGR
ncbi:MAG: ferredoxin, partial [Actinobacteria bacterium]